MTQQLLPETPEKTQQQVEGRETSPDSAPSFQGGLHPIAQLQRTLGNRNVAKLIQAKRLTPEGKIIGLQRKLTVGAADDQYEQEADRVARQVLNIPDAVVTASAERAPSLAEAQNQTLQTKPLAASITPIVQRQREKENEVEEDQDREEEKDESLQAKSFNESAALPLQRQVATEEEGEAEPIQAKSAGSMANSFEAGADVETQLSLSKGRGSPLPDPVRAYMEPRFGVDFSQVRVHTGSDAIHMNRDVGAQAFTHGSDIYFGAGSNPTNLELTAHELTHVIQQTGDGTTQRKLARGEPDIFLRPGEYNPSSRAEQELLAYELTHVVQQDGEQLQRARTQAKEGAATGGAPSGREKGPLNFLSTRVSAASQPYRSPSPMLDLQRQAGLRPASAVALARRTEPGEGSSGKQVDHGPAPEQEIADPASGRSMRRLRVVGLPDAFTDWAIVLVPSTPPPAGKPIDILLHLHGFAPGYEGLGHTEGKQPNTDADDIDLYRIGPQMAAAGRPMIGILPQGSETADFNANDPKKSSTQNAQSKGFDADAYVSAVFARLADMGVWRGGAPVPGNVVLSGHSGADMPIAQMVSSDLAPAKLSALFLFDTMYPGAGFEKTIWAAIERRLDQDLFTLSAIDAAGTGGQAVTERRMVQWVRENGFRVYNVHGSFYGESSKYLVAQRDAWLKRNKHMVGPKGSPVYQAIVANLKVTPGGGGHWGIIGADDHLKTAIEMLDDVPDVEPAPTLTPGRGGQGRVSRQPAPQPGPQPAPPPQRTPAQQVNDAAERVRDAVRAAAAPFVGTADGDDIVDILTQQLISQQADPRAALRRRNPNNPALPLYDALYGPDVVAALGTIDTRSPSRDAANATRRELLHAVLAGLVTDVRPRTVVAAPAAPLDEAVQIAGERAMVPRVLPFIASGRTWEDVRVGVITEFGGLVDGTRTALARADAYFGALQPAGFRNVTRNTSVHTDLNAAFARADAVITRHLADTSIPQPQRTEMETAIRTALGRNTFSAVLRENRNAPHRLSDHSFGFAIDIDSSFNPNIGRRGGLGPVEDVTGDDPTGRVTVNRTVAQVETTATDLRAISDEYKAAMTSDATLAPVLLRLANEGRGRVAPPLPALVSGADLVAAVVLRQQAARAAALRAALWPEGAAARVPAAGGGRRARPPAAPAPPSEVAAAERRIERIGNAFRASFTDAARTRRVGASSEGTSGTVAAHGFMTLPSILVGALAGSDGGNLRWLGTKNQDFMHFELMTRPALFTAGAIVDPAPPDATHAAGAS